MNEYPNRPRPVRVVGVGHPRRKGVKLDDLDAAERRAMRLIWLGIFVAFLLFLGVCVLFNLAVYGEVVPSTY